MKFTIDRQNVCMEDDIENHKTQYKVNQDTTFSSLFFDLIKQRYFANVSENHVVWTLMCNNADLISWKVSENKLYTRFITSEPNILSINSWINKTKIYFTYYSAPIKRAKYIYSTYNGLKFHIWHEGFMPEYKSYKISKNIEDIWDKELKKVNRL